jgi:hypothetical protein
MAIFKYPSKLPNIPRYSIPEFNFTRIGRPNIDFKKSDGVFDFCCCGGLAVVVVALTLSVVTVLLAMVVPTMLASDDVESFVVDMTLSSVAAAGSMGTVVLLILAYYNE